MKFKMTFTSEQTEFIRNWLNGSVPAHIVNKVWLRYGQNETDLGYKILEAHDIRFKISGLEQDFSYKVPTLRCTLRNLTKNDVRFINEHLDIRISIEFILLGDYNEESDTYDTNITLLRTCWFCIKNWSILNESIILDPEQENNAFVSLELIPRVYAYNKKIKWCFHEFTYAQSPYEPITIALDLATHNAIRQAEPKSLPPFLKTDTKNRKYPFVYKVLLNREDLYGEASEFTELIGEVDGYDPRYSAFISGEYTPLSLLSKLAVFYGAAIVPEQYPDPLETNNWESDKTSVSFAILPDLEHFPPYGGDLLYRFDIVDVLDLDLDDSDIGIRYIFKYYEQKNSASITDSVTSIKFDSPLTGLIESSLSIKNVEYDDVKVLDTRIYNDSNYSSLVFLRVEVNKNGFSYYYKQGDIFPSDNWGIEIKVRPTMNVGVSKPILKAAKASKSYTINSSIVRVKSKEGQGDLVDWADDSRTLFSIYSDSTISGIIKFSAMWRPWLNVYDVVRIPIVTLENGREIRYAILTAIDANADTMTAEYTALALGIGVEVDNQG